MFESERPHVPEITIDQLAESLEESTVLDCREPAEYLDGHVPGALLIPMGQVPARLEELDASRPVHVICATGNRSLTVARMLIHHGFEADSVAGGTTDWARSGRKIVTGHDRGDSALAPDQIDVITLETPGLGDRSYLVHDGTIGFVVDPQRDIDRVLQLLDDLRVRVTDIFESHLHNDYLTGGLALARRTGAAYHVNAADEVGFDRSPIEDGDEIAIGERMLVTAVATPGHTFTHLSYVLTDRTSQERVAVFTGGSLLFGATGRPDLLGPDHAEDLARHQHASAHTLAQMLPDEAEVFPTHGFGSFCSSVSNDEDSSTIGQEKRTNPALTQDVDRYVTELFEGLTEYPAYYAHMSPGNAAGPSEPDLSPPSLADPQELRRRIEAGEWIVDLRHRQVFAASHLRGALNFGLEDNFVTYVGWLIEWGTPLTLLGENAEAIARAQRELVRIGIDRPAAAATGDPESWNAGTGVDLASYPMATFADLAQVRHHRQVAVLDVRRSDEFRASHIEGAINLPIHEISHRLDEVPDGEVWVHCGSGYRSAVVASLLDAAGIPPVCVDDEFPHAAEVGLPMTSESSSRS